MKTIEFEQINETLYHEKLDNGLQVYILPKTGFNKTFATFTTNYGSIDHQFKPLGKDEYIRVPDGIAHFLEHKMFEKEDGDVFQKFSKQGASANAFTSFTRTAYLFSSTNEVEKNLITLIDMVQEPYFTEKSVEKEKGIIGQEIRMYDDNPDWRLFFGTIENMYHHHPVKIDIAGTVESISHITADLLYECYHTFYHPSNMLLFVVGPVNPDEIMNLIRSNQAKKQYSDAPEIQRYFEEEPETVNNKKQELKMNVQTPKCYVGIKSKKVHQQGREMLKHELALNMALEILFGKSSNNYEELITSGLIDDTFQYDITFEQGFGFGYVGSDTNDPDTLSGRLQAILLEAKNGQYLSDEALQRIKKKRIGGFLRSMNSPEFIANQFTRYTFNGMNLFDTVSVLEELDFDYVKEAAKQFIEENRITVCQVVPKK
ncbi:EF-P 5-aminopentanol modification-associated protein YfmH [Lederbergia wuyishanensis]|uniref:Zn-dependent peptidase n=1 Tax=Lederbergia wuyishanensis TaxID=1347903 RepID=A0ABU0CZZ8_9BACI|nr:pitrilysin family protein [Lederbergia wuyishanensis]MCJ8006331.1 insulinase family protein [Lederbergia wuyishanensis]MDQ0341700.1 putative Zn-dependent peptidase [Lederbergia wuyishanensis]